MHYCKHGRGFTDTCIHGMYIHNVAYPIYNIKGKSLGEYHYRVFYRVRIVAC